MTVSNFFFFFFLTTSHLLACELDKKHDFISLSGPVTSLLVEFDLLQDKQLKGISTFHPISFKGIEEKKIAGGVLLSQKAFKDYQNLVLYFDQSAELKKVLSRYPGEKKLITTRGINPFQVFEQSLTELRPYLVGCEERILKLQKQVSEIKEKLFKHPGWSEQIIFFLGHIKTERFPNLIILNDLFVKFWIEQKKLKTYPSELEYVVWSKKILDAMPAGTQFVGVHEADEFVLNSVTKSRWNVGAKGALIPGLSQIYFMRDFTQKFVYEKK
ncbi:MAG: hypothetical protein JNM93_06100 [Bacteriovoracaceae bacterium]|nr:hypothetical protein [Bacteriovoracaceae bacterium]